MFTLHDLIAIFEQDHTFAWKFLYYEIMLYQSTSIDTEKIKKLIEFYSIGMEKLNHLKQQSSNYFKCKINELMGEKRVIRCLNQQRKMKKENETTPKHEKLPKSAHETLERDLQSRKRQLEIRLAYDIESTTTSLNNIINEEKAKESKIQKKIFQMITNEQQKLSRKIRERKNRIQSCKNIKRQLQNSMQMTESSDADNLQSILADKAVIEGFILSEFDP